MQLKLFIEKKIMVLNTYIKKERSQNNKLNSHLKKLETEK